MDAFSLETLADRLVCLAFDGWGGAQLRILFSIQPFLPLQPVTLLGLRFCLGENIQNQGSLTLKQDCSPKHDS